MFVRQQGRKLPQTGRHFHSLLHRLRVLWGVRGHCGLAVPAIARHWRAARSRQSPDCCVQAI
eukprot:3789962-Rhodomonas_salina.2